MYQKTQNRTHFFVFSLVIALSLLILSCSRDPDYTADSTGPDLNFYALTTSNQIVKYNAKNVSTPIGSAVAIAGLASGENIISIDFRPATGQLFGLSSLSRLYTINVETGKLLAVGSMAFTPPVSGTSTSIDFNPTVDRIRVVSNNGQNLRVHPETGATAATDGAINGGSSPSITGIAYTNSFSGSTTTTLFDLDATTDKLYKQDPPNNGTLVEVGSLGVDFSGAAGFDIAADNNVALAALSVGGQSKLYGINTTTGMATYYKDFSAAILDIAIPTPPVAYAVDAAGANLSIFNPMNPSTVVTKAFTGLNTSEKISGIDFRPATGQLFALGTTAAGQGRLFSVNTTTAALTAIGSGFTYDALAANFGFDFNPMVDRIRLVTNTGKNMRINPNDGVITTDGDLNPGTPSISGAAYSNNFQGATSTTLFVIDGTYLYKQDPPNNGTIVSIGALGVMIDANNGFDIGSTSGMAYGLFTVGGITKVYSINLTTGAATALNTFPSTASAMTIGLGF